MNNANQNIRFIHSSDWQLGMTRAFLTEEAASRFSQARIDTIIKLGELAEENDASFIVVAGDVFESNQLSRQTLTRTLEALKSLPVPIFLLPGNHDPLDGSSIFSTKEFEDAGEKIIVIQDTSPIQVHGLEGVEVVGSPWRTKHPSTDLCGDLLKELQPAQNILRIAVAHGQTDNLSPDTAKPDIINLSAAESALENGKIHYLALGDRHSMTNVGSSGKVWYSGAPLVTAFDEVDPNKALLVDMDRDGRCEVHPLEVGSWEFIAEEFPMNGKEDLEQFSSWLAHIPNKARTAIKVGFKGSINLATSAELDEIMDSKADLFASLRLRKRTTDLAIVPDDLDNDSVSLAGYAKEAWDDLISKAEQDNQAAQDALKLLYRLSRQDAS